MEDKIFELMTKMYGEMQQGFSQVNERLDNVEQRLTNVEEIVTKNSIAIERIESNLNQLMDGYKFKENLMFDSLTSIHKKIDEIKQHEIKVEIVK